MPTEQLSEIDTIPSNTFIRKSHLVVSGFIYLDSVVCRVVIYSDLFVIPIGMVARLERSLKKDKTVRKRKTLLPSFSFLASSHLIRGESFPGSTSIGLGPAQETLRQRCSRMNKDRFFNELVFDKGEDNFFSRLEGCVLPLVRHLNV